MNKLSGCADVLTAYANNSEGTKPGIHSLRRLSARDMNVSFGEYPGPVVVVNRLISCAVREELADAVRATQTGVLLRLRKDLAGGDVPS